jgi:DNA polymerase V
MADEVEILYGFEMKKKMKLPLFLSSVSAGPANSATDHISSKLDLNEYLIKHPKQTFFVKVKGDSMIDSGINEGDILIVDRSMEARNYSIIIAVLNNEFTVKRVALKKKEVYLIPENPKYKPIKIDVSMNFSVWGLVTYVIKQPK